MGPKQLRELKALTGKWDEQRVRATADEDWCSLLNHAQCLFQASLVLFMLAYLLGHLLAVCYIPAPSKTLLAKVLVAG